MNNSILPSDLTASPRPNDFLRPAKPASRHGPLSRSAGRARSAAVVWALPALVLLGLIWRAPWLMQAERTLDADEAVTGLMAMDIVQGARPVYYYGQGYLGTIEPFTAAGLFAVLGSGPEALRLAPLLLFVLSLCFQFVVVRHWFGCRAAWWSLLPWCAAPATVALWTVKARGGFTAVLLFGMMLTWTYQQGVAASPRRRTRWLLLAGLVLGFGWWTNAMVIFYALPLAVLVLRRIRAAERCMAGGQTAETDDEGLGNGMPIRYVALVAAGLTVGLIPAVLYRLAPGGMPPRQLFDPDPSLWVSGTRVLFGEALPALLDTAGSALGVAALLGAAVLALAMLVAGFRAARAPGHTPLADAPAETPEGTIYLALLWIAVPLVAVLSNQVTDVHGFRYLLPLFSALSLSFGVTWAYLAGHSRGYRAVLILASVVWLVHSGLSLNSRRGEEVRTLAAGSIARALSAVDASVVTAPYWDSYRLSFLTGRRLAAVPFTGPIRDLAGLRAWQDQTPFCALLAEDNGTVSTALTQALTPQERVRMIPTAGRQLVVVEPADETGWEQRKAELLALLRDTSEVDSARSPDWAALQ